MAKLSREKLICQAIDAAIAKGIKIWPGAAFNWTDCPFHITNIPFKVPGPSGQLPSACSWSGAIQLLLGRERDSPESFTKKEGEYLGVGTYWLYRFHIGFDRSRQIVYKIKNDKGKLVDKECKVSKLGLKLRKKYIGW